MPSLRHSSKPSRTPIVLLAMVFTVLAVMAIRPLASLAAPIEPPAEPEPPQLSFEPGSYDFGLQSVNNGSSQANFQLRNIGSEAVHVDSVEISPSGDGSFSTNTMCPGMTLQPNETCWVQVYFGPRNASGYAAQLRANTGPYSFTAELTGTGGRASLEPAFNPTDFGVAKVGSAGAVHEITVTNTGNMPGGAFIAVISGGAVGSFQLLDENCTGRQLAPAATCTLQVRFRPLSEGVKTAMLGLFGDSDGGTQIALTGVGSAPDPAPSAASGPTAAGGSVAAAGPAWGPKPKSHKGKRRHTKRHSKRAAVHTAARAS
jgi:hypothetical protein